MWPFRRKQRRQQTRWEDCIHIGWDGSVRVTDIAAYFANSEPVREHLAFLRRLSADLDSRKRADRS